MNQGPSLERPLSFVESVGINGIAPSGRQGFAPSDLSDRVLVLCWHTFLGAPDINTDLSLAKFGAQLDTIKALGYRFITIDRVLAGDISGRMNIAVTIDDGHRTVPRAIERVLVPRGIVPTLFVYPAVLGTTDFSMSDTVLAQLVATGIPVGAHGYHHLYVNEALFRSQPEVFMKEIYKSKARAEGLSGRFVLVYAYPYGSYSPRTEDEVEKAGFAAAFAVKPGFVYANPGLNDTFALPRLVVTHDNWADILQLLQRNAALP